jgi:hypothetical protein
MVSFLIALRDFVFLWSIFLPGKKLIIIDFHYFDSMCVHREAKPEFIINGYPNYTACVLEQGLFLLFNANTVSH